MKLERLHEYVLPVVATLGGMGLAIFCGKLTGTGQMGTLAFIVAISVAMALILGLRQNVWLLIPVGWVFYGQVPVLPLPFAVRDLVVVVVFVGFLGLMAFKVVRVKPKADLPDLFLIILIIYIVTVYVRNPVGVNALGSERVGGRPYFDTGVGLLAYWVLARARADRLLAPLMPFFVLGAQFFEMFLNLLAFHFPKTAPILTTLYTGVDPSRYEQESVWRMQPGEETSGRQMYLSTFGSQLALVACSFWRPLTLIFPIYWFRHFVFVLACVLVGLSGFRSGLIGIAVYMVISSMIRRGFRDLITLGLIGVPLLAALLVLQGTIINLPKSIQRSLSFLPARWDQLAIAEARGSTQWRLELWKIYLTEDKYIDSKWLGDGFGFSQRQLAVMNARRLTSGSDMEEFLIVGNVHSGPLSTIRYAGYVGLAIYLIFLSVCASKAWKLARRAMSTPHLGFALFICIPVVYAPLYFLFIFGSFDISLPISIYYLGLLKMLDNSLDAWERESSPRSKDSAKFRKREAPRLTAPGQLVTAYHSTKPA